MVGSGVREKVILYMQETCIMCCRYIYYFLYLADTNPNDYTALDAYVAKLVSILM